MLFTPHLYSFKGHQGATFAGTSEGDMAVYEAYADVMYCAALNEWVLDGKGTEDDAPFRRGDFHEWMVAEPKEFGKAMNFAFEALTGKRLRDELSSACKGPKNGESEAEGSKKKLSNWIGRRLRRF